MSRHADLCRRAVGWTARLVLPLGLAWCATAMAQQPVPPPQPTIESTPNPSQIAPLSGALPEIIDNTAPIVAATPTFPGVPKGVEIVRFHGPEGVVLEVLGPMPEAVPQGDGHGLATVGLKVGVGYRLRLSNLPNRPGEELYPVVEIVGHLHRPEHIDPSKYPIRIVFSDEDLDDAVDRGRLVTQAIYLEDPDHALPVDTTKDAIPIVSLTPAEDPLKVSSALGRVMALVRIGGRRPTQDEIALDATAGSFAMMSLNGSGACPFTFSSGDHCKLPCGPACGTPPPAGRPWLPKDEFLCDGGDRGSKVGFAGDGTLRGIDPRDAVINFRQANYDQLQPQFDELKAQFDAGKLSLSEYLAKQDRLARSVAGGDKKPKVLPTNVVCIYAPRFALVRVSVGADANIAVQGTAKSEFRQRMEMAALKEGPKKMTQNQGPEIGLHRARASMARGRIYAGEKSELRVLSGYIDLTHIAGNVKVVGVEARKGRQKAGLMGEQVRVMLQKSVESAVLTGIVEGANETVSTWKPNEMVGLETPPNKPGLAVIKRVDVTDAEAGDTVTFTIQYRNMGNTPIAAVSVIDSLLPRLKYVPESADGTKGAVFSATENKVGSTELRWDLPGVLAPNAEGYVTFKAIVR